MYVYDMAYEQDPAKVKADGGIAMARYFVGPDPTYAWKRVTPEQVASIRAAGLGVVVNYEGSADPIGTARSQGIPVRTYGQNAAKAALVDIKACGIPQDGTVACYFSLDDSYGPANFPDIDELFNGHHDVMDPARIQVKGYGDGAALKHLISVSLVVGKQWLAAPSSWPGYDPNDDTDFCMVQLVGSPVPGTDQNIVHTVTDAKAIGAWWPAGSPYDPPAPGVLMALTDAEQAELLNKTRDLWTHFAPQSAGGEFQLTQGFASVGAELAYLEPLLRDLHDTFTPINAGGKFTVAAGKDSVAGTLADVLPAVQSAYAKIQALPTPPTVDQIAAAVVKALPPPSAGGLTEADVVTAVKSVFAAAGA